MFPWHDSHSPDLEDHMDAGDAALIHQDFQDLLNLDAYIEHPSLGTQQATRELDHRALDGVADYDEGGAWLNPVDEWFNFDFDMPANDYFPSPPDIDPTATMASETRQSLQAQSLEPSQQRTLSQHNVLPAPPPINAPRRSLPRQRSRYLRTASRHSSLPVAIPQWPAPNDATRDPMQRWRDSPPEAEAASLSAIANALKDIVPSRGSSSDSRRSQRKPYRRRGASSTSAGTSVSSRSTLSSRSATSHRAPSRRGGVAKTATGGRRRPANADTDKRPFQCTFCCDSFRTKYDWSRHETSLHLSLEKWICTPHGGAVISQATGRNHCAYCNMLDPAPEHLETHNHSLCHDSDESHVFSRKDHLVQHLRLVHHLDTLPLINDWKIEAPPMVSRCGFCDLTMHTWRQRVDHLTQHFHEGKTMETWQGDHGFEPAIASQVMNALPPYTLGAEGRSFVPFSATTYHSRDHILQMQKHYEDRQVEGELANASSLGETVRSEPPPQPPDSRLGGSMSPSSFSSMKWITLGLGRFAQRQMRAGVIPTDAMFQDEARRLIYGSEDGWEQTIADNGEWLANFRLEHCEGSPAF